jgi:hypothetical protein
MVCSLLYAANCSVEYSRYYALQTWQSEFPSLTWSGANMSAYFDGLVSSAAAYEPSLQFGSAYLYVWDQVYVSSFDSTWNQWNQTNFSFSCLSSQLLSIWCSSSNGVTSANITFYVPSSNSSLHFNIDTAHTLKLTNGWDFRLA